MLVVLTVRGDQSGKVSRRRGGAKTKHPAAAGCQAGTV